MGFSVKLSPVTFGFAITTLSINLFGNGSTFYNVFIDDIDINNDTQTDTELLSNYQENLNSQFKSPLSVLIGASYVLRKISFFISADWFNAVNRYSVLDPASFKSQTGNKTVDADVEHSLHSVINIVIGAHHEINNKLFLYGGFITNFSALNNFSDSDIALASWDIWHTSIGGVFSLKTIDFTLGFSYGFGNDSISPLTDLSVPIANYIDYFESPKLTEVSYNRWRILAGFSVEL